MSEKTDIDIDMVDREKYLSRIPHVPALASDNKTKHVVGVYFQDAPKNPVTKTASINFKEIGKYGFFKVDFLNNTIYENVRDDNHLNELLEMEPDWDMLLDKNVVVNLAHIHRYFDLVSDMKPRTVVQLAMVIALIRPAKKHLIGSSWEIIEKEIWKPSDDYYFKKSHAVAYAMAIVIQMNLIRSGSS